MSFEEKSNGKGGFKKTILHERPDQARGSLLINSSFSIGNE